MAPLMQMPSQLLAGLGRWLMPAVRCVLDIAAGHGLFGIAIANRFPKAHVTALDWANVLAVAQENGRRAGVADRYSWQPGSAFEVAWGGPYDVVLLTNFLHHFDVPTCEQLTAKAYAALAPAAGATLEIIPEPDRISPPATATFALTMLATTAHGDAYTFAELESMFAKSGFPQRIPSPTADHATSRGVA